VDMYENSFRMRGKTYDYKVPYDSIKRFMVLPKPDEIHQMICLGLDPPLRQGQTRYPFIVMQFRLEEEVELDLNISNETINEKYQGKLQGHYEASQHHIVSEVLSGLAGKKIVAPSKAFESHHRLKGVKCSIKASEGYLFPLERAFMFVPKPAQWISYENISIIVLSRVGGAISASRTFDITIELKGGAGEHAFSNINREEQQSLMDFFEKKSLKVRNEMVDDSAGLIAQALKDEDMASSEDEVVARADRGSADEDEESVDEDFQADSESDVAEEFDSEHDSSGSGGSEAGSGDEDEASRPKKKAKN
jgi:structure-specific recognition protein 1